MNKKTKQKDNKFRKQNLNADASFIARDDTHALVCVLKSLNELTAPETLTAIKSPLFPPLDTYTFPWPRVPPFS